MEKIKQFFSKLWVSIKDFFVNFNYKKVLKIFTNTKVLNSFAAIFVGLLIGFIVMIFVAKNPFTGEWSFNTALDGLERLFGGGSRSLKNFGDVLFKAAPLILVGLSVGFAFKTGLFNIGASGQFMVGGVAALYAANLLTLPTGLHFVVAALAGIAAGAIWGFVPGILKAIYNVNEVITTIMMNYIAMYLTVMMVTYPKVYDGGLTAINTNFPTAHTPVLGLDKLFPGSNIDISIIIAILVAVLIWFVLEKTTLGYQLKAVGHSKDASKYAGINYKKSVAVSMMIAGGLAGLAAALYYLPIKPAYFRPIEVISPIGFEGISIALIGQSHPLAIIFSGTLISYIKEGASQMQLFGFNKEITNIVISVIIYMIAISSYLGMVINKRKERKRELAKEEETDEENKEEPQVKGGEING
ncbi:ABC transporter permease [Mycoplasmatota bacterium]|nr:ABC transporter permease [Mycoplasmatota bacterium]